MGSRKKKDNGGEYVESFERLTGVETHRKFVDPDTGAARLVYSDEGARAVCNRLIEGKALESDYVALRDLEAGMDAYYPADVQTLICEASAALILSDDATREWLDRVARDGLESVRAADSARTQVAQSADAAPTEDEIWAARFRQGSEIIASCGEGAKRKHIIEALLRANYTCAEVVKISGVPYQSTYAIRNALAAEYLRKQLPVPENLRLRRIGQYTPISDDMGKAERKRVMNKNLLIAAGDAGQAPRSPNARGRKARQGFGEDAGLEHIKWDDKD